MALTAAQRRAQSRRTTAAMRARIQHRRVGHSGPQNLGRGILGIGLGQVQTTGNVHGGGPQNLGRGNLAQGLAPGGRPITPGVSAPGAKPTPGVPSPARPGAQFVPDAQYLASAAQAQFQRQTQLDQIKAEHEASLGAYTEGQRRLMEGVAQQRQNVSEGANKEGLFYSGQLGKRLGDLETQIARQRADAQNQFTSEDNAREAARAAILQGGTLEDAALKAEAVSRQVGRDTASAQANRLAPTPVPRAARPKPRPQPRPRPRPRHRRRRR